jgi:hypothetical protein
MLRFLAVIIKFIRLVFHISESMQAVDNLVYLCGSTKSFLVVGTIMKSAIDLLR